PLTTAELSDAFLATQALEHDADLLFCRELSACRAADVFHDPFRRFLHRPGFLSHLRSLKGYDEPEILPSSTRQICLIGADGGHQPPVPIGKKAVHRFASLIIASAVAIG